MVQNMYCKGGKKASVTGDRSSEAQNLGRRVALVPGKFLYVRKVFLLLLEKKLSTLGILSEFSGWPFSCPDYLTTFQTVSKLFE